MNEIVKSSDMEEVCVIAYVFSRRVKSKHDKSSSERLPMVFKNVKSRAHWSGCSQLGGNVFHTLTYIKKLAGRKSATGVAREIQICVVPATYHNASWRDMIVW